MAHTKVGGYKAKMGKIRAVTGAKTLSATKDPVSMKGGGKRVTCK